MAITNQSQNYPSILQYPNHSFLQKKNSLLPRRNQRRQFMAGAWSPISRRVLGSTVIDLSRSNSRTGGSLPVRISARSHGVSTCEERETPQGPSCIFVGPVETASKETLEALYRQVMLIFSL